MTVDKALMYRDLQNYLREPQAPKADGRIWSFCPSHADGAKRHNRSLSLHPEIGVICFAGCTFVEILKGFGLPANAFTVREESKEPRAQGMGSPVTTYEYRDADGTLIAVKGRWERTRWVERDGVKEAVKQKTFLWRPPDADRWGPLGMPADDLPLWGAERLSAAPPDAWVFFVEGEKAANACRQAGLVAVCSGVGAQSAVHVGRSLSVLKGRKVALWPDNDVPGRQFMATVRSMLEFLAAEVRTISVPLPPKGDAYDYFHDQHGKAEDLLNEVQGGTGITVLENSRYLVSVDTPLSGVVQLVFDDVFKSARAYEAQLTVKLGAHPYSQRVNMLSSSARRDLQSDLGKLYGADYGWPDVINTAFHLVQDTHRQQDFSVDAATIPFTAAEEDDQFLIQHLWPLGEPSLLYGQGESGKTYLCLCSALAVTLGHPLGNLKALMGPVLWVDYETDQRRFRKRLQRLLLGLGLEELPEGRIFYRPGRGLPLSLQFDAVDAKVKQEGIVWVVVDSAARAVENPRDEQFVIQYYNALSRLGITTTTLAHITKDENPDKPFGSVHWREQARRAWFLYRDEADSPDAALMGMVCKKKNDGPDPPVLGWELYFEGSSGPVTLTRRGTNALTHLEQASESVRDRLLKSIRAHGGFRKEGELADDLGMEPQVVARILEQWPHHFRNISLRHVKGKGRIWGIQMPGT